VNASGSVAQVEKAFGTTLNLYRFQGHVVRAASSAVSIPASVAGVVSGVTGLDQTRATPSALPPLEPVFLNAPPCSKYWAEQIATDKPQAYGQFQPYAPCGLRPNQIRKAYGFDQSSATGAGVTIGILDAYASPTLRKDLKTYSAMHNLPVPNLVLENDTQGAQDPGWYGEQSLDVEASHSIAPQAAQIYLGASNSFTTALDQKMNEAINAGEVNMISNSYGVNGELNVAAGTRAAEDQMYQQAAAQGIGIYFSSGDEGDETENLGQRETDWPAASAWVTAVGGTSLAVNQGNTYDFETYWGTFSSTQSGNSWNPAPPGAFKYAGGGGTSRVEAEPSYQQGVVPTSLSGFFGGHNRVEPDISLDGDPSTGFLIGFTQLDPDGKARYSEQRIGGTSLSSPLMAGVIALADQLAGTPHGFLNPALYSIAGSSDAFHDIVAPATTVAMVRNDFVNSYNGDDGITTTLRTTGQLSTLHILTGYDDATGLGTPNGANFLNDLP
jgi:subtilase family serine protease